MLEAVLNKITSIPDSFNNCSASFLKDIHVNQKTKLQEKINYCD